MRIKDMVDENKPREKAIKYGVENLSTSELLAILLRTGYKGVSVNELSNNILIEFNNFNNYSEITLNKFSQIKGVGITKAITILSAIEFGKRINNPLKQDFNLFNSPQIIFEYFKDKLNCVQQEKFIVVLLNNKKKLVDYRVVFVGDLCSVNIHPREIFKYALINSAASIILVHNHPSGDVLPSKKDVEITNQLTEVGKLIQIYVIDHIIIGKDKYYSFFDNGVIR